MGVLGRIFESAIVTLREGVEVALVIGVLLAYLRRTSRQAYGRYVFYGLGAAICMSIVAAIVIQRFGFDTDNPAVEGALMFVAAGLVASLIVWMWRTGRSIRRRLEQRLDTLMAEASATSVDSRAAFGLFAFAFFMVLREGVETVLFLAALSGTVGGSPIYNAAGGTTGLLFATLFGTLLVRGSLHINLKRFFNVTGIVLLILVLKLIAGGLHEFFEVGILASTPILEAIVEVFTQRIVSLLIVATLVALPTASVLWDWWTRERPAEPALPSRPRNAAG